MIISNKLLVFILRNSLDSLEHLKRNPVDYKTTTSACFL